MESNRETKRVKVIALPTERSKGAISITDWGDIDIGGVTNENAFGIWEDHHLYFITDDEIEEDDWCLNTKTSQVFKTQYSDKDTRRWVGIKSPDRKKIVATTDPNLLIYRNGFNIVISLPKPSKAFIEKYCKVGGIDEVEIECIFTGQCKDPMLCLRGCSIIDGTCKQHINKQIEIKVNSHNEITIHPIKDSWSKEELQELIMNNSGASHIHWIYDRMKHVHNENENYDYMLKLKKICNWIENNL